VLTVRVIPCLDVRNGQVVKGVKFQNLREVGSPAELAGRYERQGADELALLDVSATDEGRATRIDTVQRVRKRLGLALMVGGGVRSVEDAGALLDAGADKVGINTAAVKRPALIDEVAARFGSQCTVLAIDAAMRRGGRFEVVVRSGKQRMGIDAIEWAREAVERGAGEILLTSWDRDGTKEGYDLVLLEEVTRAVGVPIIASGGASDAGHMASAARAGATGLLAASMFHYRECSIAGLKSELVEMGVEVRR
jgi:cyclase